MAETAPLTSGSRLGVYEIVEKIGTGSMGQVYRARDTSLDREVAIKVLPADMAADPEFLARFEREAKSLASLNHSNIAQIYDFGHLDETHYLSLEFVRGRTLDERLARGPLPVDEAIKVARDIAEGLEAAHEAGVVHRDLKPANIRVTPEGSAKLLDFGLAKPVFPGSEGEIGLTVGDGRLLGTPTYMAPEQTRGKPVDRRVDIWAFGCVLYECLVGRRAFESDSLGTLFNSITTEAADLDRLPPLPSAVRRLIERCLRKSPRDRLRDIGDARVALEEVLAGGPESETPAATPSRRPALVMLLVGLLLGGTITGILAVSGRSDSPTPSEPQKVERFSIALPPSHAALTLDVSSGMSPPLAISPDGRTIVFGALTPDGEKRLYRRSADDPTIRPIEGTDGADFPVFCPDGKTVGFSGYGGDGLRTVSLVNHSVEHVSGKGVPRGADWDLRGRVVYGQLDKGLVLQLPSGETRLLRGPAEDERNLRWPKFLPGGDRILFTAHREDGRFEPQILTIEGGDVLPIGVQGTCASFVPGRGGSGFLVYVREGGLWAARLDPRTAELLSDPVKMVDGIHMSQLGLPHFAVSPSGVLVYEPKRPPSPGRDPVWVDREGKPESLDGGQFGFEGPKLSPADSVLVFADHNKEGTHDVWTMRYGKGGVRTDRITSGRNSVNPAWSPEGDALVFSDFTSGEIWAQKLTDTEPRKLLDGPRKQLVLQWVHDRVLFATPWNEGCDLQVLNPKDGSVRAVFESPADERAGQYSPDLKWIAYSSNRTGRTEIFVRRVDPLGRERPVSVEGGTEALWSKDGSELFFRNGAWLYSVRMPENPDEPLGKPEPLFKGPYVAGFNDFPNYDVTADGERFLMLKGDWGLTTGRLDIHLHFDRELEEALPEPGNGGAR